ncbi:hypothetical protein [Bifidobacterium favimelis]|uniref:Lipoprotein n=1 Tax=Bifidobacterium favimelis TaxID=3122979 RepID=A0ABU8ZP63_9BIFI
MKKSVAIITTIAALVIGLSACGGNSSSDAAADKKQESSQSTQAKPADLTGTWKQENPKDKDNYQEATITADSIEVNWVGKDSKDLYWSGSFTAPTSAGDYTWTSKGNKEKLSGSLLASQDESKDFKYTNGEITYKVSALGETTTVHLKKQ